MAERRRFVMLMVDNGEGEYVTVKQALAEEGRGHDFDIDLRELGDGEELLEYLDQCGSKEDSGHPGPNFIVLNGNISAMSGGDDLQKVKSHPLCRRLPVIVFTGSANEAGVIECYHCGGNVFRQKPSDSKSIRELVRIVVNYWLCSSQFPVGSPFECMGYG